MNDLIKQDMTEDDAIAVLSQSNEGVTFRASVGLLKAFIAKGNTPSEAFKFANEQIVAAYESRFKALLVAL
jgi:hypothetical protein